MLSEHVPMMLRAHNNSSQIRFCWLVQASTQYLLLQFKPQLNLYYLLAEAGHNNVDDEVQP